MALEFSTVLLIIVLVIIAILLGYLIGKLVTDRKWHDLLPGIRGDAIKRSRSVLTGHFSEQLAPFLPDFPYSPTEARFIGKPIDFIVFKGMDKKDIRDIVFVEVKSGKASLSGHERRLRDVIKDKRVNWEEYRVPEKLSNR